MRAIAKSEKIILFFIDIPFIKIVVSL